VHIHTAGCTYHRADTGVLGHLLDAHVAAVRCGCSGFLFKVCGRTDLDVLRAAISPAHYEPPWFGVRVPVAPGAWLLSPAGVKSRLFSWWYLAARTVKRRVMLADGFFVEPFEQAVGLAIDVVAELDLPHTEFGSSAVSVPSVIWLALLTFGRVGHREMALGDAESDRPSRSAKAAQLHVSIAGTGGANVVRPRPLPSSSWRLWEVSPVIRVRIQATLNQKL